METKLEVGKEYWLSARKISRGIFLGVSNSGNFDFRITLASKYTKELGALDVMTSNMLVYSEYVPEKPWSFTTPIAMKCTKDQFDGIKDRLVEIGYKPSFMTFMSDNRYLCTVGICSNNHITDYNKHAVEISPVRRLIFETFNPELFLAIAAMTDKEDGIKGEWWTRISTGELQNQKIPRVCNYGFRKATVQEIIEYFEKMDKKDAERIFNLVLEFQSNLLDNSNKNEMFFLPKNFKILRNSVSFEKINKWAEKNSKENFNREKGFVYFYDKKCITIERNCQEITFDQFKKYVLKEPEVTIIPIQSGKQAELFEDRVEITDWKPEEGELIFGVHVSPNGVVYGSYEYASHMKGLFSTGFIKRTEPEAKTLVEKLKAAML